MNEQEMKAAIKYFTPNNHPEIPLGNYHKHIQSLLDLAESYLSIQGFPEKKCGKCYSSCSLCPYQKECPIDEKNKLIETMKLALLKKMDGIEDVVCNACNDCIDKTGGCAMLSNISKAIKDHLTK